VSSERTHLHESDPAAQVAELERRVKELEAERDEFETAAIGELMRHGETKERYLTLTRLAQDVLAQWADVWKPRDHEEELYASPRVMALRALAAHLRGAGGTDV